MNKSVRKNLKNKGTALIYVILIVALLTGVIVNFLVKTKEYVDNTGTYEFRNKAYYIALSGIKMGSYVLSKYSQNPEMFMQVMDKIGTYSTGYPMLGGTLKMDIEDEDGKFNINRLVYPNGSVNQTLYQNLSSLFTEIGVPLELLQNIEIFAQKNTLDYRELESSKMKYIGMAIGSPLSSAYLNIEYKNSFINIRDLMLVPGMEYKYYYLLKNFLTVYSSGYINLNTAPYQVIEALSPLISESSAKDLVSYRTQTPLMSVNQVVDVPGFGQDVLTQIVSETETTSNLFVINAKGIYNNIKCNMSELVTAGNGGSGKVYTIIR